jgi:hypothetical protein
MFLLFQTQIKIVIDVFLFKNKFVLVEDCIQIICVYNAIHRFYSFNLTQYSCLSERTIELKKKQKKC